MADRSGFDTRRSWRILSAMLFVLTEVLPAFAEARPAQASNRLIVVYQSSGAHALEASAAELFRSGRAMAAFSADHSDSLDRWHERHRVRGVSALFRNDDGSSLSTQRSRMARRLSAALVGRSARGRAASSSLALGARAAMLASAYAVDLPADADSAAALAELRADPHVAYAQVDHAYQLDYAPNDPYLATRGAWGQSYADLWGLDRIGARQAWQTTRGAGQVVAVVDTGLDYTHPDIAANVWINSGEDLNGNGVVDVDDWNGIDDDENGLVDDLRGYDFAGTGAQLADESFGRGDPDPFDPIGHGTHVSGTIAAVADNGIGIAGVAPEARVMAVKGFDDDGNGRDSDLWAAVLYAVENGAGVVNASWSCSPACPDNPLARQILAIAADAGVVFVTSAGNRTEDVVRNEPERTTAAITVGSLGEDDELSIFSNRGWLMDLIAPGGGTSNGVQSVSERNILSLAARKLPEHEDFFRVGDGYYRLQGTSMAAPHVTGAVALLRSVRPDLTVDQVRRLLRLSARDLPPAGHDPVHGAGALDVARLLGTPLPDLDLAFVSPAPGAMRDPLTGAVVIVVRTGGTDAVGFTLARSTGLTSDVFEDISAWSGAERVDRSIPWDASSSEPGPQILRLRATLRTGEVIDEYLALGLESVVPRRLSRGAFHEVHPDISGRQVVWEALSDTIPIKGQVVAGGFRRRDESLEPAAIDANAEISQTSPRLDGNHVVWKESMPGSPVESLVGCMGSRIGDRRSCSPREIVSASEPLEPFDFSRGFALWSDAANGREIAGCGWPGHGACLSREFGNPDPAVTSRLLAFDGRTILWRTNERVAQVGYCQLQMPGRTCIPSVVMARSQLTSQTESASLDGDVLALELFAVEGSRLAYCRLDLGTGACDLKFVRGIRNARNPAVSGRRIVWSESPDTEDPSIVYCELDPIDGSCVRKRLTGAPFPATGPRIDGNRIVWEDARFGPTQILGIEVPGLEVAPRVHFKPSGVGIVPINRLGADEGEAWQFELEGISGVSPVDLKAQIMPIGRSKVVLIARPGASQAGQSGVWRIRARTPGGLETSSALEVLVDRRGR